MTLKITFRSLFTICALLFTFTTFAQAPQVINYQAVVRDAAGEIVKNKTVNFRLSILDGGITGTPQYIETQSKTTNQFGLVTFGIGQGTTVSGSMSAVTWASSSKFLKVELDIAGGNNFSLMSTSQFLSVPFALYAATSGSGGASSQWANNNVGINYNAGSVGLGTNAPTAQLHTLGSVRFQGLLQNNALTKVMVLDANNNVSWRDASTLTSTGGGSGWLLTGNAASASDFIGTTNVQNLKFYTNNTQKAVLTPDGLMGIGTAFPPSKLSVETNSDGSGEVDGRNVVDIKNTSTSYASEAAMKITAGTSGTATYLNHHASTYTVTNDAADQGQLWNNGAGLILRASPASATQDYRGNIRFYTGWKQAAFASNERMRIEANGNVGIGTITPTHRLRVETESDYNTPVDRLQMLLHNRSTNNEAFGGLGISAGNSGTTTWLEHLSSTYSIYQTSYSDFNDLGYLATNGSNGLTLYSSSSNFNSKIRFAVGVNGNTAPFTRMTLNQTGLGVGTETPKAKIEVANGDVYLTDPTRGIILKSPNGNCWRVTVDNAGNLVRTQIACP